MSSSIRGRFRMLADSRAWPLFLDEIIKLLRSKSPNSCTPEGVQLSMQGSASGGSLTLPNLPTLRKGTISIPFY